MSYNIKDHNLLQIDKSRLCTFLSVILLLAISLVRTHASVTGYIESSDRSRFLETLVKSLTIQEDDVISPYYGALGFKLLDEQVVKVLQLDNCAHLQKNFKSDSNPETAFYALSAFSSLGCNGKLHNEEVVKVRNLYKIASLMWICISLYSPIIWVF